MTQQKKTVEAETEKSKNKPITKRDCIIGCLIVFIVIIAIAITFSNPSVGDETVSKSEQVAEATPEAETDSIATFIQVLNKFLNDKLIDTLSSKEIQSKLNPLDTKGKMEFFRNYIIMYATHAAIFERVGKVQDKEVKKLLTQAKNKLKKEQQKIFPLLRKEYADVWSKALWRNNIEVRAVGTGSSRLEFIGAVFANNANIEDLHNAYFGTKDKLFVVKGLRFKRIAYLWNKNDKEYTYYSYDTPADEIIDYMKED
ncbi:hypothetical protein R83H12_03045 [Fibrobacteria bacterium R8-3-H12]